MKRGINFGSWGGRDEWFTVVAFFFVANSNVVSFVGFTEKQKNEGAGNKVVIQCYMRRIPVVANGKSQCYNGIVKGKVLFLNNYNFSIYNQLSCLDHC